MRMSDLASATLQSKSRLSHQITRMENANLVRRENCESDRRGLYAVLTEHGLETMQKVAPHHVGSVRRHFIDLLSPEAMAELDKALKPIAQHLRGQRGAGPRVRPAGHTGPCGTWYAQDRTAHFSLTARGRRAGHGPDRQAAGAHARRRPARCPAARQPVVPAPAAGPGVVDEQPGAPRVRERPAATAAAGLPHRPAGIRVSPCRRTRPVPPCGLVHGPTVPPRATRGNREEARRSRGQVRLFRSGPARRPSPSASSGPSAVRRRRSPRNTSPSARPRPARRRLRFRPCRPR